MYIDWMLLVDVVVEFLKIPAGFLFVLSVLARSILKTPAIIVNLSVFPFDSISFCVTYFAALLFDAVRLLRLLGGLMILSSYNIFSYVW